MSFDYDLVVIGSTQEGIYAAKKAVLLKARVALVTQASDTYLNLDRSIYNRCLHEITNSLDRFNRHIWGFSNSNNSSSKITLEEIKSYANLVRENIISENSLAELAILGVDVIEGKGEFCRLPKQAFLVNNRQLLSRNYLLATGIKYPINYEYRQKQLNCFTPDDLWRNNSDKLPRKLVIFGESYYSIELAQGLARLGKQVTLAIEKERVLPEESVAAERLFQAQLAADKITLLLNSPLKQIKIIDRKTWLQIGDLALDTEAVILTKKELNIKGLNLEGVGVKYFLNGITVNEKLQTTNKSIYACGNLLGNNTLPHVAQYEVNIALKNMFLFPWFKRDYRYLPIVMLTQPNFARVGIANPESLSNKHDIYVVKQHFKSTYQAQITAATTGWVEFIIKANGEILGCTIIGDRANELINLIAMMMRRKIKLNRNPIQGLLTQEIPDITFSYSEIFNRVTIAFHEQKIQRDRKLKNRLETWFDWRHGRLKLLGRPQKTRPR